MAAAAIPCLLFCCRLLFALLTYMPSYLATLLDGDPAQGSTWALPGLALAMLTHLAAGRLADGAIRQGWKPRTVRRLSQGLALFGPAALLAATCCTREAADKVALLTMAQALQSFSTGGPGSCLVV